MSLRSGGVTRQAPPAAFRKASLAKIQGPLGRLLAGLDSDIPGAMNRCDQVFIHGPEGSGKTYAMAALANEILARGWLLFWLDCFDIPGDPREADEVLDECIGARILFLDDLGKEPEHIRRRMRKLFQARTHSGRKLLTLYSTNLDVDPDDREGCALSEFYGPSIRSRLLGDSTVVRYTGEDRRMK